MTLAAIYTRVSSEEQVDGTSLETQEERCLAYCVSKGWQVTEVYTDAGVSGAKASRPSLDRLMAAARAQQVNAIMVYTRPTASPGPVPTCSPPWRSWPGCGSRSRA